jgi:predicted PurR-regulated permease PerM
LRRGAEIKLLSFAQAGGAGGSAFALAAAMSSLSRGVLIVAVLILVWLALDLLLLLFAGVLLAIFLRTLATFVARASGLSVGWALVAVCVTLVGSIGLGGWLYAPQLAEQSDQLTQALPQLASDLTSRLRQYSWGEWILDQFSSPSANDQLADRATRVVRGLMDGVIALVIVIFTGLYLAAQPAPYLRGVLFLIPVRHRTRAAEVLYAIHHVLRWWLVGQVLAMTLVGLTVGIGLSIIGVRLSLLLGVLAGLFEFVPLVGPVVALGPALLLASAEGTRLVAWVLGLYLVVQNLEGYVLTPLVQQRAVELPPVVTIAAQLALSWIAGPIGLIVAVPLTAALMVATQMLYVEDTLGDDRAAPDFETTAQREVEEDRSGMLRGVLPSAAANRKEGVRGRE